MNVLLAREINQGNPTLAIALIDNRYNLSHEDISEDSLWINMVERGGLPGVDDDDNGFMDDYSGR